ncbi:MAG TPA: DUF192 domain-containing protein [Holophaga sp.]|nr:DUF192 domain-containing protein [Holophaga sp.]HPS69024.1 DUF192 domain-containing protein [Holophaga sp.]
MQAFLLSLLLSMAPVLPSGGLVAAKGHFFKAEAAVTPQEQMRGLMYRDSLARDRCMIFLYDTDGHHAIWMKNCLIALDVIWVKEDGTITEIAEKVPPLSPLFAGPDSEAPTYGGKALSRHFVEFPVGTVRRLSLRPGDRIGWRIQLPDGRTVTGGQMGGK